MVDNLKLSLGVFMSGDVKIARQLVEEKSRCAKPNGGGRKYFARLREGRPESIESSSLHLDIAARSEAHPFAYLLCGLPILEATGELQPSRLKQFEVDAAREPNDKLAGARPQ